MRSPIFLAASLASFLLVGCSDRARPDSTSRVNEKFEDPFKFEGTAPPSRKNLPFSEYAPTTEFRLSHLPLEMRSGTAFWPSYFWPRKKGGLNAKLFGAPLSPVEKAIESLRAVNEPSLQQELVQALGKMSPWSGEVDWSGYCNNNVLVSTVFPEPVTKFEVGGQTFRAFETKAILALNDDLTDGTYDTDDLFVGDRIYRSPSDAAAGRPQDPHARDANPGAIHIALANFLPSAEHFVWLDLAIGSEVLMFGVQGAKVLTRSDVLAPEEILKRKALNPDAAGFTSIQLELELVDSHRHLVASQQRTFKVAYDYTLELDEQGRIIGGEWDLQSIAKHPDFVIVSRTLSTQPIKIHPALAKWFEAREHANHIPDDGSDLVEHRDSKLGIFALASYLTANIPNLL